MFLVDFDGTQKYFRLIYDIIHGDAWLDEEFDELALISRNGLETNFTSKTYTYIK